MFINFYEYFARALARLAIIRLRWDIINTYKQVINIVWPYVSRYI